MTHCAKCGAELIGTRKFCTACGAPAVDPRSPAASTGMGPAVPPGSAPGSAPGVAPARVQSSPSIQYAPSPASAVNPYAQTAGPKSMPVISAPGDYGPPPPPSVPQELATTTPGVGDPSKAPQVSPLAVSNVDATGGAMVDAMVASARAARAAALNPTPEAPTPDSSSTGGAKRGAIPGTQLMPSMANPPLPSASSAQPQPSAKRPDKTQLLGAIPMPRAPSAPRVPSAPPAPSAPASVKPPAITPPAAQSGSYPSGTPDPSHAEASGPHQPPRVPSYPDPSSSQPGVPLPQGLYPQPAAPPPPIPSPHQGWNPAAYVPPVAPAPYMPPQAPAYPPAPPAYGYGYPPGTRVNVTWSNGQRYPGTVQQSAGNQCLVVFPDGQHHWVDLQYVGPA